jgi:hypothetical protein
LSWKTREENEADKIIHGTGARGEKSGLAKLTESDVHEIRALGKIQSQREIASKFGVSRSNIGYILAGTRWVYLLADAN